MKFDLKKAIEVLERTPGVLNTLLDGLSADWTSSNEGGESWSAYDVVGHLIHGEKTDWIPRADIILSPEADKHFRPFDRFSQMGESGKKTLQQLLQEFSTLRKSNMERLRAMGISDEDLAKTGIHPAFGEVTLAQLLATWVAHDLNHIGQISRVMAKQYKAEVGPWVEYLRVMQS
ncbi:DinB family protein [Imperialibacter roseus]|uniref:DinB family protein n=1 Tax=Imperialibacter roseus TaxID=1324217 RepID=A0ABZ0IYM3_9BACT|nr:DinB family protein [Imperialibacter roseus]WOK09470.1 DinB family protein [Imperialibacter roseus]